MKPENLKCPKCDGPMVPRLNKADNTKFWGCKNFPHCKGTRDTDGMSWEERQADKKRNGRLDFGDDLTRFDRPRRKNE